MLFSKPQNIKYTDMCIYVDSIIPKENPTEQELSTCFEYIYHLGFMLSHKHKYFNKSYYYEEFAAYLATEVMHRLFFNPRLREVDENGDPSLTKIKSVLNYMKAVIYGRKIEFEQVYYSQKIGKTNNNSNYLYSYNDNLYSSVKEVDIELYLNSIPKTVKHIVYKNNFYKNDKVLIKNIYLSCLLTVTSSITFTRSDIHKLKDTYSSIDSKYRLLSRLYSKNRENSLILYHLDNSFSDYIKVLSNKILKQIKEDLSEISNQNYYLSEDTIMDILLLEINGEENE